MQSIEIRIVVDENGINCDSTVTAAETIYWMEQAKKIVLEDSLPIYEDPPSE